MRLRLLLLALASLAVLACGNTSPNGTDGGIPAFKGLIVEPQQLAFTCVVPGCDTTLTTGIRSNLGRRVAIKRIVLSNEAETDFTFVSSQPAPFILGEGSSFTIDVRYAPVSAPSAAKLSVLVAYTDASPIDSPDRIEPGELEIPLVRRLVGEPVLEATPGLLSFGVVTPGNLKTLPVTVKNGGFGNIALDVDGADAGSADIQVDFAGTTALIPGASFELPVTWAPAGEAYLTAELVLSSSTPNVDPRVVQVEGTSITQPRIAFLPPGGIDLGEVPRKQSRQRQAFVVNQGGLPLTVSALAVTDPTARVVALVAGAPLPRTLQPLEKLTVDITLDAQTVGPLAATLTVDSDDPTQAQVTLDVTGTVTEPELTVNPTTLDFGTIPMGWVLTQPIELKNTGYGPLTLKRIGLVAGTSSLFTLRNVPSLPAVLERDQRIAIEVEIRAEVATAFNGALSIESDDPDNEFTEVSLLATVGTCAAGCPIANGTPSCTSGSCTVGACNPGYHDTDSQASNGCECREPNTDPGGFCSTGVYKGTLRDSAGTTVTHVGIVHDNADLDYVWFYAEDASQFLRDDFDVRIRLDSPDPGIQMCVYRHGTANHDPTCYLSEETCPTNRYYRKDGSLGSEDGADFVIKVYRTASSTPTCTSYTVFMSNG